MNKSFILRLKQVISESKNFEECLTSLNLDIKQAFMCFFEILEDTYIYYNPINNYDYLLKLMEYFKEIYLKLSLKNKNMYRKDIVKLQKLFKKMTDLIDKYDKPYFKKVVSSLDEILNNQIDINKFPEVTNNSLYDILYEAIFTFESLNYLDLLIEKNPCILNVSKDKNPIIFEVIKVYLEKIKDKDKKSDYYIRVINKFFHEKTFDLSNQIQDSILKTLTLFLNNYKYLNEKNLLEIQRLILYLKKEYYLENYNIKKEEYELTEDDLKYLQSPCTNIRNRIRLNEHIITIDDDSSKVLDDAISIKKLKNGNILFQIHIADPLAIFPYNSSLIKDAKERTSSIYEANSVINMLPNELSSSRLSLVAGEDRFTKTFCFEYNKEHGIVNFKILDTIINVSQRTSYDEFNKLYNLGGTNNFENEMFMLYEEVMNYIQRKFKNVKIYEQFKRDSFIGYNKKTIGFSESLISYLMMFLGYKTAEYFDKQGLPYVFRCHQFDSKWQAYLDKCISSCNYEENRKMLRYLKASIPKSFYTRDNVGHMGLNVPYYSHTTSPLRRFSDILNFHAINTCYFNTPNDRNIYKLEKEIDLTCDYINLQSNSIDEYFSKVLTKK